MSGEGGSSQDWLTPGAFDVAPGVHRIPLPLPNDGLRAVNVYVLPGPDGAVVIDSGWALAVAREALAAGLRELGLELADISRFLVTHVHRDHYTQAVRLRREFGMRVGLGIDERPSLEASMEPIGPLRLGQAAQMRSFGATALAEQIRARAGETSDHEGTVWELPDEWLRGGDVIETNGHSLDVVATPGHTHGHVVFHDTAGSLLFAGDHVLPTITPSIGFQAALSPNPLGAFLGSLASVRARPDALLLPAHGPVAPSVHQRVDALLAHHGTRLDATLAAVAQGAATAYDVAGVLRWTRHERRLAELDMFNQMLATAETGFHLELLVAQGRLTTELVDGVAHHRAS